jgi:hypothetical protein
MLLLGYRMMFSELCVLLNIRVDPDADYVEDDAAREVLEKRLRDSVKGTSMTVMELENNIYYLGIRPDLCAKYLPAVATSREMSEKIAHLSIAFQRELKSVGLFKHLNRSLRFPEPYTIQSDLI